jgi:triosephosphate isomerase (TIM)
MAGNWKMYKTAAESSVFFEKFNALVAHSEHCEIAICPPFPNLPAAVAATQGTRVGIGAQNMFWAKEGAYTGEVSGAMIRSIGCSHVIIGHSERRQYFGETNESVRKKAIAAIEAGLTPIICVGELLEHREAGQTEAVILDHCEGGTSGFTAEQFGKILFAYEPVWAIGTGKTATPEMAADAHRVIRAHARDVFGQAAASQLRILYGGSVKPDNIKGLMAQPEIDGALVGGASLDPVSFASIVNF